MLTQERITSHYSLRRVKFLFFLSGEGGGEGELGGLNINVTFRMRKEGGYSCLYLIHMGWIA